MLKIYGVYRSRATRPLWLAEEMNLSVETVPVIQAYRLAEPMAAGAQINTLSPEFLAVNPMGSIPSMDDDGFVLHESLAITLYLARKYGGELGPKDIAEEGSMIQWSLFAATSIETPALKISATLSGGKADTDEGKAEIEVAARTLKRPFDVLEKHLSANSHMVGGRFTVADINVAEVVRYAQGHAPLFDSRPALKAWIEACQARPGFKAMWDKRTAEPA
jgi:glutathione S-transferase